MFSPTAISSGSPASSKVIFQSQLNDSRVGHSRGNQSKAWVVQSADRCITGLSSGEIRVWLAKLGSVGKVEKLDPELHPTVLGDRKVPLDPEVQVKLAWTA